MKPNSEKIRFHWMKPIKVDKNLRCDFCGRYEGQKVKNSLGIPTYITILVNHYEQHLDPPRTVNICTSCHAALHGYVVRGKKKAEKLIEKWAERTF